MGESAHVKALHLVLPLPPSINHQYATVQGRRVLSRAGRDYKQLVVDEVERWIEHEHLPASVVTIFQRHYLSLSIVFYFVTALRRDLDGGLKIAQDALCEALGVNDNLVVDIHLTKRVDRHNPRIEVSLATLPIETLTSQPGEDESAMPALPVPSRSKQRRKRRKLRSLEELATRYNWDR
jgi:crossover junction endodeoxyribonuclease RusA